jgi:hypothetical protein
MSRTLTVLGSLLVSVSVAQAQVDGPPPPAPPPSAISQINGVPVKVGERNEYVYTFKPWNVSANPIGWIMGIYGVSLSYGFHPNAALHADVTYYNMVDSDLEALEISAGVPLYFRRTYQGLFLEPGLMVRSPRGDEITSDKVFGPQVLVGWHWTWDSGFNVAVASGFGRNLAENADGGEGDGELFFNGYLRFGYSF